MSEATQYKPAHGGFPSSPIPGSGWEADETWNGPVAVPEPTQRIAAELVASESPRKAGFNYGVGWGSSPKPPAYFAGMRLHKALSQIAHDATARAWELSEALRNVRLAETETEKTTAVSALSKTVFRLYTEEPNAKLAVLVNELADTVDVIAPPNPRGYTPNMGLHYAVRPIRTWLGRFRTYLAQTQG